MKTAPAPDEREALFRDFAKALFKSDMDALYRVVTPDFLWLYHGRRGDEIALWR